ncbi:MAG: hypothetical protein ACR2L3_00910 [Actinomycetota bacterium]
MKVQLKWLLVSISALIMMPAWAIPTDPDATSSAPARRGSGTDVATAVRDRGTDAQPKDGMIWRGKDPAICLMDQCPKATQAPILCLIEKEPLDGRRDPCERRPLRVTPVDPNPSLEPVDRVRSSP